MHADSQLLDTFLPLTGAWLTYFVQALLAYALVRAICLLIPDPRGRMIAWGCFLIVVAGGWVYGCASALRGMPVTYGSPLPVLGSYMTRSWSVDRSWSSLVGLTEWIWPVYFGIVAFSVIDLLLKSARLARLLRTGRPPSDEVAALFRRICREMGIDRCTLMFVPELRSPATCGVWHARVLLPESLIPQLQLSQLSDILRHELTHVRQKDCLWDRLAALACRAVFFHPVVWLARRRFRWERELACDQAVVEGGGESVLYAECLTKLARSSCLVGATAPNGVGVFSSSSQLTARVNTLLRGPRSYSPRRHAIHVVLIVFLAAAGGRALSSIKLAFHWPATPASLPTRSRVGRALPRGRFARKATDAIAATTLPSGPPAILQPVSLRLDDLAPVSSSPRLPILNATPDESESAAPQDETEGTRNPVWDEAQVPGGAQTLDWQKVAVGAAVGAVALAAPDNDTDDVSRTRIRIAHPR
jgi:beta-lactamase regulating signal transducer with metallopeptidase domain